MGFMGWKWKVLLILTLSLIPVVSFAAYHHEGEQDAGVFLSVYPDKAGTKLDSCILCHGGGQYTDSKGKTVNLGSCQWCHHIYGYDASGDIHKTLNSYGWDYLSYGRNAQALEAMKGLDSDNDTYLNEVEIAALRFPGDANDDPSKVVAPSRVFSLADLEKLPQVNQFMQMNAHKSTDFYAQYTGVSMERLLKKTLRVLPSATGIKVFAPDGWSQYHPLYADPDPLMYPVYGTYPAASFYYDVVADIAKNAGGWVDYKADSCAGRRDGDVIANDKPLKMILAYKRDGELLTPGVLTPENKLDGEGPFRMVPPQKNPGPPDQRSTASDQNVPWPFDNNADHNAGYSTRTATMVKVEPLPPGTTDIDSLEAGWEFVDEGKIIFYGAIDPTPTIKQKLNDLMATVKLLDPKSFKHKLLQSQFGLNLRNAKWFLASGHHQHAVTLLRNDTAPRVNGCQKRGKPDADDWVKDCTTQNQLYWTVNEVLVLLDLLLSPGEQTAN